MILVITLLTFFLLFSSLQGQIDLIPNEKLTKDNFLYNNSLSHVLNYSSGYYKNASLSKSLGTWIINMLFYFFFFFLNYNPFIFLFIFIFSKIGLEKTVLVTGGNFGYLNHIHNFNCFAERLNLVNFSKFKFIFVCID